MTPSPPASTEPLGSPRIINKTATTILYYAGFILLGISVAAFGPSLPFLAEHTGSRLGQVSFLFVARSAGYLLGAVLSGRLFDRRRGHLLLALAMVVMAGMLVFVPVLSLLLVLTLFLFALGFAESFIDIGENTLLVWLHGANTGPFMNALHFFYGVGAFLAPILIAQSVTRTGDIHWTYWILAGLLLPAAVFTFRRPSPVHPSLDGTVAIRPPKVVLVVLMVLFFFLAIGGEASFGGWVYTYTLKMGLGNETSAAYLTSAFWGALMFGRFIGIPLSIRFNPEVLLAADIIGSVLGVGIILLWPGSITALWIGAGLVGLSMASIIAISMSMAAHWMTITGEINRWFFFGGNIGAMALPWIIGQWIEPYGPRIAMSVVLVTMIISMVVFIGLIWSANQIKPAVRQFDIPN